MLPDNFDYALIPSGSSHSLLYKEVGMYSSTIEDIDYVITSWLKEDLRTYIADTNEGFTQMSQFYGKHQKDRIQIKNEKRTERQ